MRHPASTPRDLKSRSGTMTRGVVWRSIGPSTPDNAHPSTAENAHGMGVIASSRKGFGIDVSGPGVGVTRVVGQTGQCGAQAMVAGPSEGNHPGLARGVGDRGDAGLGGQLRIAVKALAHAAQLGQDLGGADAPGPQETHEDLTSSLLATWCLMRLNRMRASWPATHRACASCSRRAVRRRLPCAWDPGGPRSRAGIALDQGQRDGRIRVGKDRIRAGPERLQQTAQLVGQLYAGALKPCSHPVSSLLDGLTIGCFAVVDNTPQGVRGSVVLSTTEPGGQPCCALPHLTPL